MIWQWLATAANAILGPVLDLLPEGHLSLPSASPVAAALVNIDKVVPILGPLALAATVLSAVVGFITVRLVLTVWNLIYP
jgi:hypothetical protein